jgi:hypothetical protein
MAENKRSFLLYTDVHFTVQKLSNEQAGKLFKHILSYVNDEDPVINDVIIELVFEPIKQALKRDLKRYEAICQRNRDNGSKGGRPKSVLGKPKKPSGLITNPNNPDGSRNNPNNPDEPDNDSDNDSDNDKKNKKEEVKEEKPIFRRRRENGIDFNLIVESYHSLCPDMNKVKVLSDTRKGHIKARVKEFGMEKIIEVFKMAGESDFLNGRCGKTWKANFEWILNSTNFIKIMEGNYINKPSIKKSEMVW